MARKPNTTHVISPTSLEFFCRNSIFLKDKDRRFIHGQITATAEFIYRFCHPFPVGVFLYGSLARGEPACGRETGGKRFMGSDLDLIMVCKPEDRILADELAGYINKQLPELGLAARKDPNPGAKFVKVESLDEVKAMHGFAATTMAMAIKHPLYGGLEVVPPARGMIDGFMLLDQLASRVVQVTKAAATQNLPRYHGNHEPGMNRHYHDLYHKLRFGLDCCRVALGPDVENHSYREVFQNRELSKIRRLFSPEEVVRLIEARERFGEVEPPAFDLPTIIGKTLDIFIDRDQPGALQTFLQRLHWPQYLYQMGVLLSFAGHKTTFAGAECDVALDSLMDRLTELFDLELPADRSNLLTVLVEGSGRYTELRETYNHGRMTKHLRAFISAC
ncbi:MAG: hypothetical protein ACRBM6_31040 [Geminicoccales bacterium]